MVYTIGLDIQYGSDNVISLQSTTWWTKFLQEVSYNIKHNAFPATRNLQTNNQIFLSRSSHNFRRIKHTAMAIRMDEDHQLNTIFP